MFWKKKKDNEVNIKVKITKSSKQDQLEKEIINNAKINAMKCPECNCISKENYNVFGYRIEGTSIRGFKSKCIRCGTEWETEYRIK